MSVNREDAPRSSKENAKHYPKKRKDKKSTQVKTCAYVATPRLWGKGDDESNDRWVVCDSCGDRLHLQCSGIEYETSDYWDIDLESMVFECESCIDFFSE